jgi:hypothetical protein
MKLTLVIFTIIALATSQDSCCLQNVLSIVGNGKVSVDPDIATFTIYISRNGKTSSEALSKVNAIVQKATGILTAFGLPKANYSTSSINLYPQYNYTQSGLAILIGQ